MRKLFILSLILLPILVHSESRGFLYKKGNDYYFEGNGRSSPDIANKTQRLSLANEAAVMDGKAKIAFYIDSLKAKRGANAAEIKENDEKSKDRVKMILDGVETVKTEFDDDDNCRAILKINYKNMMKTLRQASDY
ncbi:MAG: hypothetical protein A2901_06010 [Elusimicrobia bacterium RIFCSPLOWO2_01_FULL_54_10]|nr:MAG: hypothetical protein A2901_06010 [Elusimicrobia bacterium RIFCSPLOWO2_01_FULL_54_10]